MIAAGTRVALTVVTIFAWFAAGQRITTIQLDGTQYYISRMNPYSAELNYFLAYEYCRSIGLQLASFETLEKTNSISDFLRNAGYNKFDYWTSGNRLGTDILIWMSTGLPFNTTFSQMKRPNNVDNNNGVDNAEDLKMNARPELPIARKKRGESGSRDGCVAIKAPNMDWVTADCTDLKDFICEQTRCYYYNYGSIPVSSSQGFGHKYRPAPASHFSTAVFSDENTNTTNTTATTTATTATTATALPSTTTTTAPSTTTTTTTAPTTVYTTTPTTTTTNPTPTTIKSTTPTHTTTTTTTTPAPAPPTVIDTVSESDNRPKYSDVAAEPGLTESTVVDSFTEDYFAATEQQEQEQDQGQDQEQQSTGDGAGQPPYLTTELPSIIQLHNRQQDEQQESDERLHRDEKRVQQEWHRQQEALQDSQSHRDNAYAFESLEKAFATAVPHKIRATKDLEQPDDVHTVAAAAGDKLPWLWAKDIMLQKPVLKKTSQEVV